MYRKLYLLLGSNLGDRFGVLKRAQKALEEQLEATSIASSYYATAAWGKTEQPDFINEVLCFHCALDAHKVLALLLRTEEQLGRIRKEKWGPRTIDIDLLAYGDLVVHSDNLKVPHQELAARRFSLVPLCELAPHEVHPVLHKTYAELLELCTDTLEVRKTNEREHAL